MMIFIGANQFDGKASNEREYTKLHIHKVQIHIYLNKQIFASPNSDHPALESPVASGPS